MRRSEAGENLARLAASGRSPKAGNRRLQLLSEGEGRERFLLSSSGWPCHH